MDQSAWFGRTVFSNFDWSLRFSFKLFRHQFLQNIFAEPEFVCMAKVRQARKKRRKRKYGGNLPTRTTAARITNGTASAAAAGTTVTPVILTQPRGQSAPTTPAKTTVDKGISTEYCRLLPSSSKYTAGDRHKDDCLLAREEPLGYCDAIRFSLDAVDDSGITVFRFLYGRQHELDVDKGMSHGIYHFPN